MCSTARSPNAVPACAHEQTSRLDLILPSCKAVQVRLSGAIGSVRPPACRSTPAFGSTPCGETTTMAAQVQQVLQGEMPAVFKWLLEAHPLFLLGCQTGADLVRVQGLRDLWSTCPPTTSVLPCRKALERYFHSLLVIQMGLCLAHARIPDESIVKVGNGRSAFRRLGWASYSPPGKSFRQFPQDA